MTKKGTNPGGEEDRGAKPEAFPVYPDLVKALGRAKELLEEPDFWDRYDQAQAERCCGSPDQSPGL